jgi:hypothetical protein
MIEKHMISNVKRNTKLLKIIMGVYDTQEQAALAYNETANRMQGEFAVLNIIEERN